MKAGNLWVVEDPLTGTIERVCDDCLEPSDSAHGPANPMEPRPGDYDTQLEYEWAVKRVHSCIRCDAQVEVTS